MSELLQLRDLTVSFPRRASLSGRLHREAVRPILAVDHVDLVIRRSAALALVGESGCGKSTIARAITGLVTPAGGEIIFDGTTLGPSRDRSLRRRIQMVFQDPTSSLNPALTVEQALLEVLHAHRTVPKGREGHRVKELLALVELPDSLLSLRPRRLSGGQRQRVAIARALAVSPDLLIADESVAALDVSVQASIINLLHDLRERLELTLLFISHDLAVVRSLCDDLSVMYLGRIVEAGPSEVIFAKPRHPYTQGLITAIPKLGVRKRPGEAALMGEPASPDHIPAGCRFHPRCPHAQTVCREDSPILVSQARHAAACHFAWTRLPDPRHS